jgi:hypothetical protein
MRKHDGRQHRGAALRRMPKDPRSLTWHWMSTSRSWAGCGSSRSGRFRSSTTPSDVSACRGGSWRPDCRGSRARGAVGRGGGSQCGHVRAADRRRCPRPGRRRAIRVDDGRLAACRRRRSSVSGRSRTSCRRRSRKAQGTRRPGERPSDVGRRSSEHREREGDPHEYRAVRLVRPLVRVPAPKCRRSGPVLGVYSVRGREPGRAASSHHQEGGFPWLTSPAFSAWRRDGLLGLAVRPDIRVRIQSSNVFGVRRIKPETTRSLPLPGLTSEPSEPTVSPPNTSVE